MDIKINKEFIITFQPKERELFNDRRRFSVGGQSLHKYIGKSNANKALQRAIDFMGDKLTVKFRKHGRIDFYRK